MKEDLLSKHKVKKPERMNEDVYHNEPYPKETVVKAGRSRYASY